MAEQALITGALDFVNPKTHLLALGGSMSLTEDAALGLGLRQATEAGLLIDIYDSAVVRVTNPKTEDKSLLTGVDKIRVGEGFIAFTGPSTQPERRRFLGVTGDGEVFTQSIAAAADLEPGVALTLSTVEGHETKAVSAGPGTGVAVPQERQPVVRGTTRAARVEAAEAIDELDWLVEPDGKRLGEYTVHLSGTSTQRFRKDGDKTIVTISGAMYNGEPLLIHAPQAWPRGMDTSNVPRGDGDAPLSPAELLAQQIQAKALHQKGGSLVLRGYLNDVKTGPNPGLMFNALQIHNGKPPGAEKIAAGAVVGRARPRVGK